MVNKVIFDVLGNIHIIYIIFGVSNIVSHIDTYSFGDACGLDVVKVLRVFVLTAHGIPNGDKASVCLEEGVWLLLC